MAESRSGTRNTKTGTAQRKMTGSTAKKTAGNTVKTAASKRPAGAKRAVTKRKAK